MGPLGPVSCETAAPADKDGAREGVNKKKGGRERVRGAGRPYRRLCTKRKAQRGARIIKQQQHSLFKRITGGTLTGLSAGVLYATSSAIFVENVSHSLKFKFKKKKKT
jgi:hypothetical protein